ncbi:TVP38/TMEM64 family protein [Paenibacillus sp. GCM10027628]|uniref:TVP38/TMEM64 family protein n=1 Tax=Paenibacillus sp. GCM10027628 TaxID=3273413 RepID=UPI00363B6475
MVRVKSLWLLLIWFLAAGTCLLVLQVTGVWSRVDMDFLSDWLRNLDVVGGLLYIVVYTLRPLVLFPATPLTIFGGFVFGAFWGTLYDIIGAGAGALLAFYMTRKLLGFSFIWRLCASAASIPKTSKGTDSGR